MKYYKILLDDHSCIRSNMNWTKYLPVDGKPGKWTRKIFGKLKSCKRCYHLTDADHLLDWCCGNQLFEAEVDGEILQGDDNVCCRKVRLLRQVAGWNDRTLSLFAAWCERETLKLDNYPNSRAWTAVWDATWHIARNSAWDAARTAANTYARISTWDSTWGSTLDSAWADARDTARAAQNKKLLEMIGEEQ